MYGFEQGIEQNIKLKVDNSRIDSGIVEGTQDAGWCGVESGEHHHTTYLMSGDQRWPGMGCCWWRGGRGAAAPQAAMGAGWPRRE